LEGLTEQLGDSQNQIAALMRENDNLRSTVHTLTESNAALKEFEIKTVPKMHEEVLQ
jgi:hypothetical protein